MSSTEDEVYKLISALSFDCEYKPLSSSSSSSSPITLSKPMNQGRKRVVVDNNSRTTQQNKRQAIWHRLFLRKNMEEMMQEEETEEEEEEEIEEYQRVGEDERGVENEGERGDAVDQEQMVEVKVDKEEIESEENENESEEIMEEEEKGKKEEMKVKNELLSHTIDVPSIEVTKTTSEEQENDKLNNDMSSIEETVPSPQHVCDFHSIFREPNKNDTITSPKPQTNDNDDDVKSPNDYVTPPSDDVKSPDDVIPLSDDVISPRDESNQEQDEEEKLRLQEAKATLREGLIRTSLVFSSAWKVTKDSVSAFQQTETTPQTEATILQTPRWQAAWQVTKDSVTAFSHLPQPPETTPPQNSNNNNAQTPRWQAAWQVTKDSVTAFSQQPETADHQNDDDVNDADDSHNNILTPKWQSKVKIISQQVVTPLKNTIQTIANEENLSSTKKNVIQNAKLASDGLKRGLLFARDSVKNLGEKEKLEKTVVTFPMEEEVEEGGDNHADVAAGVGQ